MLWCSLLIAGPVSLFADTLNSLQGKVVLSPSGNPWIVPHSLNQKENDTLLVQAGVQIMVDGYFKISCRGTVQMQGTAARPITISASDSVDSWMGFELNSATNTLEMENVVINHAFRNVLHHQRGFLRQVTFRKGFYGLQVNQVGDLRLDSLRFEGNRYALDLRVPVIQLNHSIIENNAFAYYPGQNIIIQGAGNSVQKDEFVDSEHVSQRQRQILQHLESRF